SFPDQQNRKSAWPPARWEDAEPARTVRKRDAPNTELSSRLTREEAWRHEKPSVAWPVCCSALSGSFARYVDPGPFFFRRGGLASLSAIHSKIATSACPTVTMRS